MGIETVIVDFFTGDYRGIAYTALGFPAGYMVARLQPKLERNYGISERMKAIGTQSVMVFTTSMLVFFLGTILLFINATVQDAIIGVGISAVVGAAYAVVLFSQLGMSGKARRALMHAERNALFWGGYGIMLVAAIVTVSWRLDMGEPAYIQMLNFPVMYLFAFMPYIFPRLFLWLASMVK